MTKQKKAHPAPVKAHARFSASGSKRWLECSGSIALSDLAPPSVESKYAAEGTRAHSILEYLVKNREKRLSASAFLMKNHPAEMVIHAESALKYIDSRLAEHPGAELLVEVRADLPVSEPGQFGTTDVAIVEHFGRLIVIDYKYGAGIPVHPEENPQLLYYALGIAHQFDYNFSEVEIVIIQPRAAVFGGDGELRPIRTWTTTVEKLLEWRAIFERGIQRAKEAEAAAVDGGMPDEYLKAGEHCRFCPAKILCPEVKNRALRDAQASFDDETGEISVPAPVKLPKLEVVLPALEKLEIWIDGVREYAERYLEEGGKIPGWGLVEKRPSRVWTNEAEVLKAAAKKFDVDEYTPRGLVSPAQLEKLGPKGKEFVAKYAVSVSSGLKLGPLKNSFDDGGKDDEEVKTLTKQSRKSRK